MIRWELRSGGGGRIEKTEIERDWPEWRSTNTGENSTTLMKMLMCLQRTSKKRVERLLGRLNGFCGFPKIKKNVPSLEVSKSSSKSPRSPRV